MYGAAIRRGWIEEVKSNPNPKSNPNVQKQRYQTISFFRSEGERAGAPPAENLGEQTERSPVSAVQRCACEFQQIGERAVCALVSIALVVLLSSLRDLILFT